MQNIDWCSFGEEYLQPHFGGSPTGEAMNTEVVNSITELPHVVDVPDQPCQQLYERNPVLLGYDVVQYHFIPAYKDGGVAVRGKPEYAYNFEGYQFWFSTEENRNLFIGDPWKYAPAWGGFCSYGVGFELPPRWPWADDYLGPPASPWEGWFIEDGILGFNIWSGYTDRFLALDDHMNKAKDRWIEMRGQLQAGPFNTHCIGHGPLKNWCLSKQPSPWLSELPSCEVAGGGRCEEQVLSGGTVSDDCLDAVVVADSGGIVGRHAKFDDFSNQSISPHAVRLIKIFSSVGFVTLFLICAYCCYRRWPKPVSKPDEVGSEDKSGEKNKDKSSLTTPADSKELETATE